MRRLLVIDDEPFLLETLCGILPSMGVDVVGAKSYQEALALLRQQSFHTIISDFNMPGKSGIDLLRELRETGEHIPFILMSGHVNQENVIEALRLGAMDLIQKPFPLTSFLTVVENALQIGFRVSRIQEIEQAQFSAHPEWKKIEQEQKMISLARINIYRKEV